MYSFNHLGAFFEATLFRPTASPETLVAFVHAVITVSAESDYPGIAPAMFKSEKQRYYIPKLHRLFYKNFLIIRMPYTLITF